MVSDVIQYFVLPVLSLSIVLIFIRLVVGPSVPDRVVALDLLVTISIGTIAAYSIYYNQTVFMDATVILALLAFLSTVAFAYYYEKRGEQ